MKKIGFLGCGKIGKALLSHIESDQLAQVSFIQDPFYQEKASCPVIDSANETLLRDTDLVIECATADVLNANIEFILANCDLFMFSVTAFSQDKFAERAMALCEKYNRRIYLPHGAILALDGIYDARSILTEVSIETTKNPKSLGRNDLVRTVLYEGPTRAACGLYPRNVNVHAAVALAGLGFDQTVSKIVSDPDVSTNAHIIRVKGQGISFEIHVESFSEGGVTGVYTPVSACGSIDRVLKKENGCFFV